MADFARVSGEGWRQGDDATDQARVGADGWWQVAGAGGGGVVGTVTVTTAGDTSAASGTPTVAGTLARTTGADTSAASGTTTVTGTLARTVGADTSAASGAVGGGVSGTVSVSAAADTSAASGATTVTGTLARTVGSDVSAASGFLPASGAVSVTAGGDTAAATDSVSVPPTFQGTKLNERPQIGEGNLQRVRITELFVDHAKKVNALASGHFRARNNTGTAAPTAGTWAQGDFVANSNCTELGTASSKYVVMGWVCVAGGTPGTWVQSRTLTGN